MLVANPPLQTLCIGPLAGSWRGLRVASDESAGGPIVGFSAVRRRAGAR